ncbi:MAG: STAS-like domain-containing protein [Elusimicrobia bacterium]|nr:STAS-like domain-containing protein [Elusimicrobiota bacterium]
MKIPLNKYGQILTSRPAGREAALAMKATVNPADDETVELDFEGVLSIGPSWLDEVLSSLRAEFGRDRVICLPTKNPSVIESLRVVDAHPPHSE